jgi:hypothetical protein
MSAVFGTVSQIKEKIPLQYWENARLNESAKFQIA